MAFINLWKKSQLVPPVPSQGFSSKSDDNELSYLFQKIQLLEEATKKISKDVKKYEDSLGVLNKMEQKLGQEMCPTCIADKSDTLRKLGEQYYSVTIQIASCYSAHMQICHKAVLDPLKKYNSIFMGIAAAIKERDQALQEVIKLSNKLEKLNEKEKNITNFTKIGQTKRDLQFAKDNFISLNTSLISDLKLFYDKRTAYFHPSLQALVHSQVETYKDSLCSFDDLLDESFHTTCIQNYDKEMSKLFGDLKSLSIVCDK